MRTHDFRKLRRVLAFLLCLFCLCPMWASAADDNSTQIDTSQTAQLTILYENGAADVPFSLYRVADIDADANLTPTSAFERYELNLVGLTNSEWSTLAQTLKTYVAYDGIAAEAVQYTNANGAAVFSDLTPGLFLITAPSHIFNNLIYTPMPFMLSLPYWDTTAAAWDYDVTAEPKFDTRSQPGVDDEPDNINLELLKSWEGDDEDDRPDTITVTLLRTYLGVMEEYETVTLSADESWRYRWYDLDNKYEWSAVEVVPDGYNPLPMIETIGPTEESTATTLQITNTLTTPSTPTPLPEDTPGSTPNDPTHPTFHTTTDDGGTPTPEDTPTTYTDIPDEGTPTTTVDTPEDSESDTPEETLTEDIPDDETPKTGLPSLPGEEVELPEDPVPLTNLEPPEEEELTDLPDEPTPTSAPEPLPQTGMLWWPVPMCACSGTLLYMTGWARARKAENEESEHDAK